MSDYEPDDPFATRNGRHEHRTSTRTRPLTQVEVEIAIAQVIEDMESLTESFAAVADAEAIAENEYRAKLHRAHVMWASREITLATGKAPTAKWRESQAEIEAEDEAAAYRIAAAALKSAREALSTKRARLDALRTLNANVREQVR